ncbi:7220_t:CDS:2 [Paraglomus occultum]|uniref:7220_t:CDS:1 n=1 Tax=Paraglomus occultum TaxID=144539 RepID=A0A9N9BU57_9GLOM|nr:7220_t:CDS:2 [Paraglomus occultum]
MAYNNSPYLQNSTDGRNPPINPFPNNTTMHAVGPDGKPNTVAENNTPVVGVPMMAFNNPPATIVTNAYPPPSQPGPGCCPKEFLFATFGMLLAIAGGVMWGVSKSTYTSCLENCIINFLTVSDSCPDDCKSSYDALRTSGIAILIFGGVLLMFVKR